jgi:hypothetical protein
MMKKLNVLSTLLVSVACVGLSGVVLAEDIVSGTVHTTTKAVNAVGKGTVDAAKGVGHAAGAVVDGAGKAVESVGKGTSDLVNGK